MNEVAFGYVRVSTPKQMKEKNHELQIKQIKNHAKYKKYNLKRIYQDLGKSGRKLENRNELESMFNYIKFHPDEIKVILITKLDRIARSINQLRDIIDKCIENNVGLVAINNNLDLTDKSPYNKFFIGQLALFSEFEADIIFERTWEARLEAESQGVICHRPQKQLPMTKKEIIHDFKNGVSISALARKNKVTWNTMNSRLKDLGLK
ncbi:MAG: recombinase family protein [Candidatus Nanoarchaeia archaeon]